MSNIEEQDKLIIAFYSAAAIDAGHGFRVAQLSNGKQILYTGYQDASTPDAYGWKDKEVVYKGPKRDFRCVQSVEGQFVPVRSLKNGGLKLRKLPV